MGDPSAQRVWDAALGQLQIHVTRPNYDTWLKDTKGLRIADGSFVVGVPTEFVKEWLSTRMRGLVAQTISNILGQPLEITFEITGPNGGSATIGPTSSGFSGNGNGQAAERDLPLAAAVSPATAVASSPVLPQRLNPRYTFRTFVVADCNRLAAAAAAAAADHPGEDYNPLFIYSTPGLGKTHLLQAIAQRSAHAGRNSLYVTSEQFTNEFISAIAHNRGDEFRRRYRSVQLLLMDDIQFLANKGRTQEEFFYTFNDLHSDGCQLVVASDRPPSAIAGLESRLCSRFQWGLIADIQPPDEETRLAILFAKARDQKVDLPEDVAHFLASRTRDNIRELEGSLNRVVAYAKLTSSRITLDVANRALIALTHSTPAPADPQAILKAVCAYFNVSPQALTSKTRCKPIADARHIAMYLLREDCDLALKQIGLLLGHRDHSTVIHGVHKVAQNLVSDPMLGALLAEIRSLVHRT